MATPAYVIPFGGPGQRALAVVVPHSPKDAMLNVQAGIRNRTPPASPMSLNPPSGQYNYFNSDLPPGIGYFVLDVQETDGVDIQVTRIPWAGPDMKQTFQVASAPDKFSIPNLEVSLQLNPTPPVAVLDINTGKFSTTLDPVGLDHPAFPPKDNDLEHPMWAMMYVKKPLAEYRGPIYSPEVSRSIVLTGFSRFSADALILSGSFLDFETPGFVPGLDHPMWAFIRDAQMMKAGRRSYTAFTQSSWAPALRNYGGGVYGGVDHPLYDIGFRKFIVQHMVPNALQYWLEIEKARAAIRYGDTLGRVLQKLPKSVDAYNNLTKAVVESDDPWQRTRTISDQVLPAIGILRADLEIAATAIKNFIQLTGAATDEGQKLQTQLDAINTRLKDYSDAQASWEKAVSQGQEVDVLAASTINSILEKLTKAEPASQEVNDAFSRADASSKAVTQALTAAGNETGKLSIRVNRLQEARVAVERSLEAWADAEKVAAGALARIGDSADTEKVESLRKMAAKTRVDLTNVSRTIAAAMAGGMEALEAYREIGRTDV